MIQQIVQTWKTNDLSDAPPLFTISKESWQFQNPSWKYRFFSDEQIAKYVSERLPHFYQRTFIQYEAQIQRVDIFRLVFMFFDGGLYSDLDAEAINPFEKCGKGMDGIILGTLANKASSQYIPNAFLYSGTRHAQFWLYCLALAVKRFFQSKGFDGAEFLTGPQLLTSAYIEFEKETPAQKSSFIRQWLGKNDALPEAQPSMISLLPAHLIYPIDWTTESSEQLQVYLRMRLEQGAIPPQAVAECTICINYWTHSWEIPDRGVLHSIRSKWKWILKQFQSCNQ